MEWGKNYGRGKWERGDTTRRERQDYHIGTTPVLTSVLLIQ